MAPDEELELGRPAQEAFGAVSGNTRQLSDFLAEYFMIYINGFLVFSITKLSTF